MRQEVAGVSRRWTWCCLLLGLLPAVLMAVLASIASMHGEPISVYRLTGAWLGVLGLLMAVAWEPDVDSPATLWLTLSLLSCGLVVMAPLALGLVFMLLDPIRLPWLLPVLLWSVGGPIGIAGTYFVWCMRNWRQCRRFSAQQSR